MLCPLHFLQHGVIMNQAGAKHKNLPVGRPFLKTILMFVCTIDIKSIPEGLYPLYSLPFPAPSCEQRVLLPERVRPAVCEELTQRARVRKAVSSRSHGVGRVPCLLGISLVPMRTHVIANPTAGRGRVRRLWPQIQSHLDHALPTCSVQWTEAPGDATALTRTALRDGVERVVAVGGDGTLHEVVNGFFAADGTPIASSARLTPIACGTGNDFRRSLGIPEAPDVGPLLAQSRVRPVDLLRVSSTAADGTKQQRYALNVVSFGLSSRVVETIHRGTVPLPGRALQYLGALLYALVAHRPIPIALHLDGTPLPVSDIHLVAVGNGHTFGDGLKITPHAVPDDGALDVTVLGDHSLWPLLRHLPRLYRGTHLSLDAMTSHRGRRLTARSPRTEPVWLEADGELVGHLPATIEVVPQALRLQC